MSSIPNAAYPHARSGAETRPSRRERLGELFGSARRWTGRGYDAASRTVRDEPKIVAAAAGATLLAAIVAVFAPRLWRQRASLVF